jgi:ATP-binding cassette subfamily F protein uup
MSVLLSVHELTKAYGPRPLFTGLTFDLRAGERIGLIGPNGSGKTTLLRLLAGVEEPDTGTRSQRRGIRVGYLPQVDAFGPGQTVRDVVLDALVDEAIEPHERATRAAITLTQFGFSDPDQQADLLSGGWRKRLALAREIVRRPELLLLDEPTNHLDLPGIVWFERLLRAAPFGYLVATHDRAFLRAVADEIIEVNRIYPGGYFRAAGSYDQFVERREAFLEGQARQQETVANQVRRETEWLGRKAAARTRKGGARIDAAERRREELDDLKYRNAAQGPAGIDFLATGRQTRKLLTAVGLAKSVGAGRQLFADLDLALTPGIKLGVLGANGSGKSTLLRVLAGETTPDAGKLVRAENLLTVMFEQGRTTLDPTVTLRRALSPNSDTVTYRDRSLHVAAWAKQFLFRPEHLDTLVADLSGGEQARVRIAQLMLRPADLLLLDEPANDLDIDALEVLEDSLAEFPGALVLVSHDRALMDRLCTEVIALDGLGGAASYASLDQWLAAYERAMESKPERASKPEKARPASPPKPRKLSFREQQELEGMEAAILTAEERVVECQARVEGAANAGHVALADACHALDEAHEVVDRLYQRWQELEAKGKPIG